VKVTAPPSTRVGSRPSTTTAADRLRALVTASPAAPSPTAVRPPPPAHTSWSCPPFTERHRVAPQARPTRRGPWLGTGREHSPVSRRGRTGASGSSLCDTAGAVPDGPAGVVAIAVAYVADKGAPFRGARGGSGTTGASGCAESAPGGASQSWRLLWKIGWTGSLGSSSRSCSPRPVVGQAVRGRAFAVERASLRLSRIHGQYASARTIAGKSRRGVVHIFSYRCLHRGMLARTPNPTRSGWRTSCWPWQPAEAEDRPRPRRRGEHALRDHPRRRGEVDPDPALAGPARQRHHLQRPTAARTCSPCAARTSTPLLPDCSTPC